MSDTDKANALDWLNEIVTNPDGWQMFYSASETKTCAEATLELLKEQEAVEPKVSCTEQRCGNCNKVIEMDGWKVCPWCGKMIDWERWWQKNGFDRKTFV